MGCQTIPPKSVYQLDNSHQATGKNQRIQFIILHYTAENNENSLRILTQNRVSSHYLILSGDDNKVYQLVPDHERAWHAGAGQFRGRTFLNDTSIGIEIVNAGIQSNTNKQGYRQYDDFIDYEPKQIEKLAQLLLDLAKKYDIPPQHMIGHSDIAPSRKIDPGAKFPWELLYKRYGIGAWYDEQDKQAFSDETLLQQTSISEIKRLLREYGYAINETDEWDKSSKDVVYAFQLHFNPKNATGEMDVETFAILKALNKKYGQNELMEPKIKN